MSAGLLKDRFSQKFVKCPSGCWEWTASTTNSGYGRIREAGLFSPTLLAHRVSWLIHHGEIPDKSLVLHKCDNRKCVNPSHLFLGSYKDNAIDRETKGRSRNQKGESNPASVLTEKTVKELRGLRAGGLTYRELSEKFNIPQSTIANACLHTWKHI